MARKIRVLIIGTQDEGIKKEMIKWLFHYGSKTIMLTDSEKDADLAVNIAEINGTTDLRQEAAHTVNAARKVQKAKKMIKKVKQLKAQNNGG